MGNRTDSKAGAPGKGPEGPKGPDEPETASGFAERGVHKYHHGALREALLMAAEQELQERGIEGFSLRSVSKRAGVSHAAPAHHFKDANGLLTALAAVGFRRFLDRQIEARKDAATPEAILSAAGVAYVSFAEKHTALFRLMFSSDRPDRSDPELCAVAEAAFDDLKALAAAAFGGSRGTDTEAVDVYSVWGMAHGLANLMTSGQMLETKSLSALNRHAIVAAVFERMVRQKP